MFDLRFVLVEIVLMKALINLPEIDMPCFDGVDCLKAEVSTHTHLQRAGGSRLKELES